MKRKCLKHRGRRCVKWSKPRRKTVVLIPGYETARNRLVKSRTILVKIDKLLNKLDKVDPYGDMVQNFEDYERKRHTKRLIKMIDDDLK